MAIYHLSMKVGSRNGGQSAAAKVAYITREGKYRRQEDRCYHTAHGNLPAWASDEPGRYWDAADEYERANGRLFREIEFALPLELEEPQQIELAERFAQAVAQPDGSAPLPYALALHEGGGRNPHCHLVISERQHDGHDRSPETWFRRANKKAPEKGGAAKTRAMVPKSWLEETREKWTEVCNQALSEAGHDARIDHRSYAEQGIDRVPTPKIGVSAAALERKGVRTDRGTLWREARGQARMLEHLSRQLAEVEDEIRFIEQARPAAVPPKQEDPTPEAPPVPRPSPTADRPVRVRPESKQPLTPDQPEQPKQWADQRVKIRPGSGQSFEPDKPRPQPWPGGSRRQQAAAAYKARLAGPADQGYERQLAPIYGDQIRWVQRQAESARISYRDGSQLDDHGHQLLVNQLTRRQAERLAVHGLAKGWKTVGIIGDDSAWRREVWAAHAVLGMDSDYAPTEADLIWYRERGEVLREHLIERYGLDPDDVPAMVDYDEPEQAQDHDRDDDYDYDGPGGP